MKNEEREQLKETARTAAREKLLSELREPLSELQEKRAELRRLREKLDEIKEVADDLSADH
jgi:uncharacterized membrane protein